MSDVLTNSLVLEALMGDGGLCVTVSGSGQMMSASLSKSK